MGFGKVVSIIGAALGLSSIILSFIFPQWFSWFKHEVVNITVVQGYYLTGFGTTNAIPPSGAISSIAILELIGGILVVLGSIICIVGITKETKKLGLIGGILILLGPILLVTDFLLVMSEYAQWVDFYQIVPGSNIFWDSIEILPFTYYWNLWIGFFLGVSAGVLGIIGGVAL